MLKRGFLHRYLSAKVLPIWTILLIDVFIVALATLLAYGLRYGFQNVFTDDAIVGKTVLWAVGVNVIFFRVFRTYSSVLRFSSFVDIMRIFVSLTVSFLVLMTITVLLDNPVRVGLVSVSVLFISYVLSLSMMVCSRVFVKIFFDMWNIDSSRSYNVFIYAELVGKVIMGVRVLPNDDKLVDNLVERGINVLIISPVKMENFKKGNMADNLLGHNIKLMTAPPLSEWNGKALNYNQLKEIQIEDLLQRDPIVIDTHKVASHLEGKRVMITGAAGSIGSEIMRQVASFNPYKLILVDQAETPLHDIRLELQDRWRDIDAVTLIADVSNAGRMEAIFREYRPQYIFHAAAYKHVPMMEDNVSESIQVNVCGTRIMADLAVKYGAEKFVMISTDKAVNPTNVMGCSKRICEIYVQSLGKKLQKEGGITQFITTRFGNVLGSNGSVIPRFRDQIQRGGPVTVTHPDIIRYFMTIPEACRLVLEAGSMGKGGEIYIFDMGQPVRIVDLAKRMIKLSGRTDVKIEFTGLRHGEKLYEELLNVKEFTKPTYHDKIMIATVREYDYDEVKERIQHLIDISYHYDQMEIVAAMKELVPEFISKNSCFEVLDKTK